VNERGFSCKINNKERMITKVYIKYKDKHKITNGLEHKWCFDCNEWYPLDAEHFKVQPSKKDGFSERCKICQERYNHENYMKNHDENLEKSKKRQRDNWDTVRVGQLKWFQENKKHATTRFKKYRKDKKEQIRKTTKNYMKKHPEKQEVYNQNRRKKNHIILDDEWKACKEYFNNSCAYCGLPIENHYRTYAGKLQKIDLHKEHVDDNGKRDLSNCVPSCQSCNSQKWKFELEEWYNLDNHKYKQENLDKIYKWLKEDYLKYIKAIDNDNINEFI
jgi:hypothetical protein